MFGDDVILSELPLAFFSLIVGWRPLCVEDLLARPQILRRIAVAVGTPLHRQLRDLPHERHCRYVSVAGRATHAFGDVD
jgi:hypothetical protein